MKTTYVSILGLFTKAKPYNSGNLTAKTLNPFSVICLALAVSFVASLLVRAQSVSNSPAGAITSLEALTGKPPTNAKFATWLTIKVGVQKDPVSLWNALTNNGAAGDEYAAKTMMRSPDFMVGPAEREVELILVSEADLDLGLIGSNADIYKRAQTVGLEMCPPDVGPQLLLQGKSKLKGKALYIGSKPMAVKEWTGKQGQCHYAFWVENKDRGLLLDAKETDDRPDYQAAGLRSLDKSAQWVFARPASK